MVNKPKQIGTAAETAVVRALQPRGFPDAERRALAGEFDLGDIVGCDDLVFEVKGGEAAKSASDGQLDKWLEETERERINADAHVGILVVQRRGIGVKNAHRWLAVVRLGQIAMLVNGHSLASNYTDPLPIRMTLEDLCILLRDAGYGEPLTEDVHA